METKNLVNFPSTDIVNPNGLLHINQGGVDFKIPAHRFIEQLNGGSPFNVRVIEEPSGSRILTSGDINSYIYFTSVGRSFVVVTKLFSDAMRVGETVSLRNENAGSVEVFGADVEVSPSSSGNQLTESGQTGQLLKVGENTFHFLTGGSGSESIPKSPPPLNISAEINEDIVLDLEQARVFNIELQNDVSIISPINGSPGDIISILCYNDQAPDTGTTRVITLNNSFSCSLENNPRVVGQGSWEFDIIPSTYTSFSFVNITEDNWVMTSFSENIRTFVA